LLEGCIFLSTYSNCPHLTPFEGTLHGDEWFHWVSTKDGDILLQDQKGYWNYAELTSDELISTGTKYKIDKKPSMALNEDNLNKWIKKYNPQAKKKRT